MYCLQPKTENEAEQSLGIGSDTKILVLLNLHISTFHFVNDCKACKDSKTILYTLNIVFEYCVWIKKCSIT